MPLTLSRASGCRGVKSLSGSVFSLLEAGSKPPFMCCWSFSDPLLSCVSIFSVLVNAELVGIIGCWGCDSSTCGSFKGLFSDWEGSGNFLMSSMLLNLCFSWWVVVRCCWCASTRLQNILPYLSVLKLYRTGWLAPLSSWILQTWQWIAVAFNPSSLAFRGNDESR